MDFFDKLGKKASEAYKITADKTGKIAKETKLRLKMSETKSKINEIYEEIGKEVYEKHLGKSNSDNFEQEIEDKCIEIDVLADEIESMLQQCLDLKDKKKCSICYTEIDKNAKFCPNCGEKQEEKEEVEVIEEDIPEDMKKTEIVEENNDDEKQAENSEENSEEEEKTNLEKTVEVESSIESTESSENNETEETSENTMQIDENDIEENEEDKKH